MTGQEGNAHTRLGQPQPLPAHRDPPIMTTCIHAQWWMSETLVPVRCPRGPVSGVQMNVMIGQASGHHMPGRIWADTVTSNRHAIAEMEGTRTGDGPSARQHSDILDSHNHEDGPPDAGPLLRGRRLRLGNQ
jgi:hypothetical protein